MSQSGGDDLATIQIHTEEQQSQTPAVPMPPVVVVTTGAPDVDYRAPQMNVRNRTRMQRPPNTHVHLQAQVSGPPLMQTGAARPQYQYTADKQQRGRWAWLWSVLTRLRQAIVPSPKYNTGAHRNDGMNGWERAAPPSAQTYSVATRSCAYMFLCALVIFVMLSTFISIDVAVHKAQNVTSHTEHLLNVFNGKQRDGKLRAVVYVNDNASEVHNVLDPVHAVETRRDAEMLFLKLQANDGRAKHIGEENLRAGYVTYAHEWPDDDDADLLTVNATLDGIEKLITEDATEATRTAFAGEQPQTVLSWKTVCENYVEYGIEYNAIVLFDDAEHKYEVLYNPSVDEMLRPNLADAAEQQADNAARSVDVKSRLFRAYNESVPHDTIENVPTLVTITYHARDATRRRRKLTNSAQIACVLHALKIAGFYDPDSGAR